MKPKLFYQYLFESLQRQQSRGLLLNIYVFNLINFTKLCSLLAIFFNIQETFQRGLNIQHWFDNVKSTLKQCCLCQRWDLQRWATSDQRYLFQRRQRRNSAVVFNIEFTRRVDQRWNNVVSITLFKKLKRAKNIFELQKEDDSFD